MPENDTIKEEELTVLDSLADIKASVGKIMSVDFGDVRTGLAICDASRFLASGIGYISPGGIEKTAAAVAEAAKENRAENVFFIGGLLKNMAHATPFAELTQQERRPSRPGMPNGLSGASCRGGVRGEGDPSSASPPYDAEASACPSPSYDGRAFRSAGRGACRDDGDDEHSRKAPERRRGRGLKR